MNAERKATKVKFWFDNGDEVVVLTKSDRDRVCMTTIANAVMCYRPKDGDMEQAIVMVRRENKTHTALNAATQVIFEHIGELLQTATEDIPAAMRPLAVIPLVLKAIGKDHADEEEDAA